VSSNGLKPEYFEPFSSENLAEYLFWKFEQQNLKAFWALERFTGPGVYALYYVGDFLPYEDLTGYDRPIYMGKAELPGGATGEIRKGKENYPAIYKRLQAHEETIRQAENLRIEDFWVRWMVIDTLWVSALERFALQNIRPIWNRYIKGFGNCDPGNNRRSYQKKTLWDVVHPGREWAKACMEHTLSAEDILAKIPRGDDDDTEISEAE